MKALIWIVALVIALVWTATMAVSAGVASWAAQMLESGGAIDWVREAARWPPPPWIAIWIDPAIARSLQEAVLRSLEALHSAVPFGAAMLTWFVRISWVVWGLGMLTLLGLAAGAHWLLNRRWSGAQPA